VLMDRSYSRLRGSSFGLRYLMDQGPIP
jgi:hypothetical protein